MLSNLFNFHFLLILFLFPDLQKLYYSEDLNPEHPASLQNKVMFDVRFYFARRGNENFREMTKKTFKIRKDPQTKLLYIVKAIDEEQKNHHETNNEIISGYMPQLPNSRHCPVTSFDNYVSRLSPESDDLW